MSNIYFMCNWGESSNSLLKRYSKQTPDNSGKWGDLIGTDRFNDADFYIVMDGPSEIDPPYEKTIYFQREPLNYRQPWNNLEFPKNIFYNGSYDNCHNVVTWWINKSFNELVDLKKPENCKPLSTVTSGRRHLPEAIQRLKFLSKFSRIYPKIDVYGKGTDQFVSNEVYKGILNYNGNCKLKGHYGYDYSLVLENTDEKNSWTEKLADAVLCWSFPIYSGCPNLHEYIPSESFYKLETNLSNQPINPLIKLIESPPNIEALAVARENILFKWNIWPTIERIINERK